VWSAAERLEIEAKEVEAPVLQMRAQQLSVATGLALRHEKEART